MSRTATALGLLALIALPAAGPCAGAAPTVADVLKKVRVVAIPENGRPVDRTVAERFRIFQTDRSEIRAVGLGGPAEGAGVFRIAVAGEGWAVGPGPEEIRKAGGKGWMYFELGPDGSGQLAVSAPHLLYALYRLLDEDWMRLPASGFQVGRLIVPRFSRLEGGDNYLANPKRAAAGYDAEASVRELARLGFSHVPVNALAKDMPAEQGPPGEIYSRFYYFSPDLDQFVETPLNAGAYSPEYLEANLALLKKNARLAVEYGLTPGLNISSPRSVPDAVLEKYPYLRGARVDHPFRSYRPRYTLTLSHPAVRWHYAELMRRLMKEVPELGYIYLWTNDSGSGFEYTASLYAGRNGGAYLVREWKSHESIARAAAENVLRYFRVLRDAAAETRPDFRLLFNLFSFSNEEEFILDGLTPGLDLWVAPKELDDSARGRRLKALPAKGSEIFTTTRLQNNYLLGIPSPWLAAEEVLALQAVGFDKAQVTVDPQPLAPYDVNREVLRALNFDPAADIDAVVAAAAARWADPPADAALVKAWRLCDAAVRGFPSIMLYGDNNWGFPWYRLLVRPFAPDIGRIPEAERAYYEKYMTATFNNPNLVDLGTDILWTLLTTEQADAAVAQADRAAWKPLDEAIAVLGAAIDRVPDGIRIGPDGRRRYKGEVEVLVDQLDRLRALRCYFRTLRNTAAWVAGVHGYLEASDAAGKARRRAQVRAMIDDEIRNAGDLAALFETSRIRFMPVDPSGETFNMYGRNLAELVRKKIALMKEHRDDEPRIDPDFMWRLPPDAGLDPGTYLKYR
ncbi:MAG TPA: hypothetical protein P5119_13515 [Candidatus Aminicenantes bacterium]|nr:hypothetical protein [Candidatus Aminicenantes bacterium]HRY66344.1 hypothetical protein [Candidatus Aminicenantes bacterium]HRZ73271.1 hypothetical protein [Candidatus Aminicenantes bacterium]